MMFEIELVMVVAVGDMCAQCEILQIVAAYSLTKAVLVTDSNKNMSAGA